MVGTEYYDMSVVRGVLTAEGEMLLDKQRAAR